jgi:replicative DNA helicase
MVTDGEFDRPTPAAVEAERALLGGLMEDPAQWANVESLVRAEDFYRPEHQALYKLIADMHARAESVDLVTVAERITRGEGGAERYGGASYVAELPEHAPSTANLPHYATIIRDKALLRSLIKVSSEHVREAYTTPDDVNELMDRAARDVAALMVGGGAKSWTQVSEIVDKELVNLEALAQRKTGAVPGTSTGFVELDKKLAGLHPSDLMVLAARPAMGKTALALNIAQNVALSEERPAVGIFSMEMARGQLVNRMLCCHAMVDAGKVRTGQLEQSDWDRLLDASDYLRRAKLHIDDSGGLALSEVRARSRRLKAENDNLALIVIDYLQLMRGDDPRAPREQQISSISRGLKSLAKDLNCTVLALSQLNRGVETRADKRPLVSDLRESGAIEQDADSVMFIYRDDYYNKESTDKGLAEVIIAKQRQGPTGTVKLAFLSEFTRFDNLLEDDSGLL